ncbi:unnamed protein product, partial [Rotaria socialis]
PQPQRYKYGDCDMYLISLYRCCITSAEYEVFSALQYASFHKIGYTGNAQ